MSFFFSCPSVTIILDYIRKIWIQPVECSKDSLFTCGLQSEDLGKVIKKNLVDFIVVMSRSSLK